MLFCTLCMQSFRFLPPSLSLTHAHKTELRAARDCGQQQQQDGIVYDRWPCQIRGPIDTADVNLSHYSRLGDSLAQMESTHAHNVIDMLKQKATLLPSLLV